MPKVKTFSEKYQTSNNEVLDSQLSTINNQEVTEIMNSLNNINYDEVNINFNLDQDNEMTINLNLLSEAIGIKSGVLVERILNEVLLSQDDNFYLIKLFRNILQEQKVKLESQKLKEIETAKAQKLLEMKRLEIEALAYSITSR